jgi:hypothetical protein
LAEESYPVYLSLRIEADEVILKTSNILELKDVQPIEKRLSELVKMSDEELMKRYKEELFTGGSLGLVMLQKLKNSEFVWLTELDPNNKNWLSLSLKIKYGKATY